MYTKPTITKEKRPLSPAEINLIRRARSLARTGDSIHNLQFVVTNRVWSLSVDGGKLERLGNNE